MKLNLVADYNVCGKKFVATFAIHPSNNLIALNEMTSLLFPATDGGFVRIAPICLLMCESRRKTKWVEEAWTREYREQGQLYNFEPVDRYELLKGSEVTK